MVIHANKYDAAIVEVVSQTERAIQVRNVDCGRSCWIPRSALAEYKPGVATYEDEFVVRDWFWVKMNRRQEQVLNIAE